MDRLIVGLGNPGREYANTRHNIAWLLFDRMSISQSIWKEKFKGIFTSISSPSGKVYFLKPQTFMNLSGDSVLPMAHFYKVNIDQILVVHDEIDLPFGTIAFKKGGGLAGNNGLKSIAERLGSKEFLRLRMGIGRPQHGSVSDYVLGKFLGDEEIALEGYLEKTKSALELYIKDDFQKAAQRYSRKNLI